MRQFYRIEDLKTLVKPLINLERAPEGWVTINSFAVNRGINQMTLTRFIKEKGPESREYKTENGIRCLHYKIEDLEALVKPLVSAERAPEGWVTIKGFAESHKGITRMTLSKLIKESSPESREYKMENGVRRLHYKIEDLEALVKPLVSAERAPEGWVTINGFAESHNGIIRETLSKLAKENGLESREYKTENGIKRLHYRIEDLETLIKTMMNLERAPEGWVTIKGFAESHKGITRMTLRDLIEKSNLEAKNYRAKNGWVCPHYKEEDLQKILAERNRNRK